MDASPLICKRPLLPTRLLDPAGEKGEKDSGLIEIIMTARSRESKEKSKTAMMKADFISTFRTVIFPKKYVIIWSDLYLSHWHGHKFVCQPGLANSMSASPLTFFFSLHVIYRTQIHYMSWIKTWTWNINVYF